MLYVSVHPLKPTQHRNTIARTNDQEWFQAFPNSQSSMSSALVVGTVDADAAVIATDVVLDGIIQPPLPLLPVPNLKIYVLKNVQQECTKTIYQTIKVVIAVL